MYIHFSPNFSLQSTFASSFRGKLKNTFTQTCITSTSFDHELTCRILLYLFTNIIQNTLLTLFLCHLHGTEEWRLRDMKNWSTKRRKNLSSLVENSKQRRMSYKHLDQQVNYALLELAQMPRIHHARKWAKVQSKGHRQEDLDVFALHVFKS